MVAALQIGLVALLAAFVGVAVERHLTLREQSDHIDLIRLRAGAEAALRVQLRELGGVWGRGCCTAHASNAAWSALAIERQARLLVAQLDGTSLELDARRLLGWAEAARVGAEQRIVALRQAERDMFIADAPWPASTAPGRN